MLLGWVFVVWLEVGFAGVVWGELSMICVVLLLKLSLLLF